MKIVLSKTLTSKLKYIKGRISVDCNSDPTSYTDILGLTVSIPVPGPMNITTAIDLSDHPRPEYDINQCSNWMNNIKENFLSGNYKINIGYFKGLYPIEINKDKIIFQADYFIYNPTWRDWFIVEGDENASVITFELLSHICDPG